MDNDATTVEELEDERDPEETPAIQPEPAQPIENVSREAPAIEPMPRGSAPAVPAAEQPPAIAGPTPGTPPAAPINPAVAPAPPQGALVPGSIAAQNPFNVLLAKEENIHNPFARVLAKVATHVGKGLETFAPDYQQTVAARERAAEEPSIVAQREAQTKDTEEQAQERAAAAAQRAGGQLPIKSPIPIYAAPGTPNAGEQVGERGYDEYGHFHENMFPAGGAVAGPQTEPARMPVAANTGGAGAQTPVPAAAVPAAGLPARTVTTMKPQEPQRPPLATPAEAAKLAPIGDDGAKIKNQQIADLPGIKAADFPVTAQTSAEAAEKALSDARAQSAASERDKNALRVAQAPEEAEKRKDEHLMGYAVDKDGKLAYMSKADADKLHSTFEEVKATEVNKDRQAIRQLNDVQQNVSRYRTAQNAIKENIPASAASAMAAILSDKGIGPKLEVFGVGIDTGQVNDILKGTEKAALWNKLSDPQRDLVASYLRAKSSVIAYQKALTGIGRTNKEQLDIEMEQLPTPYVGATVGNKQLDAFQENIDRATEGFPTNLPGLKSPAQVRAESEKPKEAAAPGPGSAKFHYAGGKGEIFSDDGKTWYDSAGKKVGK